MTAAGLTLSTQVPVNALAGFNQSYCIQVLLGTVLNVVLVTVKPFQNNQGQKNFRYPTVLL